MSRVTNALLNGEAFDQSVKTPMLNPTFGGQFGYSPDQSQWVSNAAYIAKPTIALLIEAPKFFEYMNNPQVWVQTLKAMVEVHPTSIEGLNATREVEFAEHNVGGAGEVQHEIVDSKRTRTDPTFNYVERVGRPFQNFLQYWIDYGMMHPETKHPLITTLSGTSPGDWLPDMYTATVLFIEPDTQFKNVVKSYLSTNMMPHGTGDITSKRDLNSQQEILNLGINFTALTQTGAGVDAFAQTILTKLNMGRANPQNRPAFVQSMDANVQSATTAGYMEGVQDLASKAISS